MLGTINWHIFAWCYNGSVKADSVATVLLRVEDHHLKDEKVEAPGHHLSKVT